MGGHQGELHLVVVVSLSLSLCPFYNGFIPLDKRGDLIRFCVKWLTVSLRNDDFSVSLSVLPPQKFEKSNGKKDLPVSEFICAQFHPLSTPSFLSSFLQLASLLFSSSLFSKRFKRGN